MSSALVSLFGDSLTTKSGDKPTAEVLGGKKAIGIYFSAHWCPPCRGFTPKLVEFYEAMVKKDPSSFELVFVSSDKNQGAFDEYYGEMPWVSLPFANSKQKEVLSKKFKVSGIPSFHIVDAEGKTICNKGREMVMSDPEGKEFPWTPKPLKELLGTSFQNKEGKEVSISELDGKVLGLYFSAHWCPPCRGFTPKLIEVYEALKAEGKDFEMIFCSSDRDEASFQEYYSEMPWLSIPFADRGRKQALGSHFDVRGIPSLVILDGDAERSVITTNAVGAVRSQGAKAYPFAPAAVKEVDEDAEGIDEAPSVVVLMEECEKDVSDGVKNWLKPIAEKYIELGKKAGEDPEFNFFTASKEGGLSERIRDECSLEEKSGPVVVLMDIPDNGGYYKGPTGADVTATSIEKLLADYSAKTLTRCQMG
jgi:nucleoredoxin